MVRLVSAKPPKIDGVEGGSATPSSTPATTAPKVSTWDQVEERQQRRRGMPKAPVKPVAPKPTPKTPRVRPDGATPPAPTPIRGEIPVQPNRIGQAALNATMLPDGTIKPWKGQINYEGLGLRPVDAGKGTPALTPAQKVAAKLLPTIEQFGSPNPLRGLRSGGGKGVLLNLASAATLSGAQAAILREELVADFEAQQYPKDVAQSMADAYIVSYSGLGASAALGADAIADASFMAAGAGVGALAGAAFFGIGAAPGAVAGAAAGWAASRAVAGASVLINIAEGFLSGVSTFAGANGVGEGKMVNLPSLDDFWIHGGFDENGNQRNGPLGLNTRAWLSGTASDLSLSAARAVVDAQYPGRFLTDEQAIEEERRIKNGHYASSADVDPKYDDYKQFIQEGYFVTKNSKGEYKVNVREVQEFLLNSVRYTQQDDLRNFLPPKTAVGDEFYKSVYLTDDILAGMWFYDDTSLPQMP